MKKPEIPLFLMGALVLGAIVILTVSNHAVPTVLYAVLAACLGGGLGITVPSTAAPELQDDIADLVMHLRSFELGTLAKVEKMLAVPVSPAPVATAPAAAPVVPVVALVAPELPA